MKRSALCFSLVLAIALPGCGMHASPPGAGSSRPSSFASDAVATATQQKLYAVRLNLNSLDTYLLNGTRSFPTLPWALPASGAVDSSGGVYVANRDDSNSVTSYTPSGRQIAPTIGHLNGANGVAVDHNGRYYIAEGNGTVTTYTADGTQTTPTLNGIKTAAGVALDDAGNIYVADTAANLVRRFTPSGTQDLTISTGLTGPISVAVDGNGKIYVANKRTSPNNTNGRITTYDATGAQTTPTITNLPELVDVSVDANAKIYATLAHETPGAQSGIVRIFGPDGSALGSLYAGTNPMGAFHAARPRLSGDIIVFADAGAMGFMPNGTRTSFAISGNVFASGAHDGSVHAAVGPPYRIETYSSVGDRTSSFSLPVGPSALIGGVAFDANGDAFVSMTGLGQVRAYDPNGTQLFSVTPPSHDSLGAICAFAGRVYVVNGGPNGSITTYTLAGKRTTPTISNLAFPTAVAADNAGNVYVGVSNAMHTAGSVLTFTSGGAPSTPTISGLTPLLGLAVSASGTIFVSAGGTVTAYSSAGNVLPVQFPGLDDAGAISIR